eukprot:gene35748-44084_t
MTILRSTTVQKNTRPIPSRDFKRSSKSPELMARVWGIPKSGPNSIIRSALRLLDGLNGSVARCGLAGGLTEATETITVFAVTTGIRVWWGYRRLG